MNTFIVCCTILGCLAVIGATIYGCVCQFLDHEERRDMRRSVEDMEWEKEKKEGE